MREEWDYLEVFIFLGSPPSEAVKDLRVDLFDTPPLRCASEARLRLRPRLRKTHQVTPGSNLTLTLAFLDILS
jgi:hypothetical protein